MERTEKKKLVERKNLPVLSFEQRTELLEEKIKRAEAYTKALAKEMKRLSKKR